MLKQILSRGPLVLALGVMLTGCGGGDPKPAESPSPGAAPTGSVAIEVRNNHNNEVEIYVWVERNRQRLGTVLSNQRELFTIPVSGNTRIRLEYRFSLGPRCEGDEVFAEPGERVPINIPPDVSFFAPCN